MVCSPLLRIMLEFNFKKIQEQEKYIVEIEIRQKRFKSCGVFIDLLGGRNNDVIQVIRSELIPVILSAVDMLYFYTIPLGEPVFQVEGSRSPQAINIDDINIQPGLEKRGSFISESLEHFLRSTAEPRLVFIFAQNPIWDILKASDTLRNNQIPFHIIKIPAERNLSEIIVPRNIEGINAYEGDDYNKFNQRILKEALGLREPRLRFKIEGVNSIKTFNAGFNSAVNKGEEFNVDFTADTSKNVFLELEGVQESAKIKCLQGNKLLICKKISEIPEDQPLRESIEESRRAASEKWRKLFGTLKSALKSPRKTTCSCGNTFTGFKCHNCEGLNAELVDDSFSNEEIGRSKYIILCKEGESITPKFINTGSLTCCNLQFKFEIDKWQISADKNVTVNRLRSTPLSGTNIEVPRSRGDVFEIIYNENCCVLVIDNN